MAHDINENLVSALKSLSDQTLHEETITAARKERDATFVLLHHLLEIERRKLFALRGHSSTFEYCLRELGLSETQAAERISAMRLMRSVPEVRDRISGGSLTLSSAAKIQRHIRRQEKETKVRLTISEKATLIQECSGLSLRQVERTLAQKLPQSLPNDKERVLTETHSEIRFVADQETMVLIGRLREIKGDKNLNELFKTALRHYLDNQDPLKKAQQKLLSKGGESAVESATEQDETLEVEVRPDNGTLGPLRAPSFGAKVEIAASSALAKSRPTDFSAKVDFGSPSGTQAGPKVAPAEPKVMHVNLGKRACGVSDPKGVSLNHSRYIPASVRQSVWLRSRGQCEYGSRVTHQRCQSRYRLQYEHKHPYALGGGSTTDNIALYCPEHNRLRAIQVFGVNKMNGYYGA